MTNNPLISVVTASYNYANLISETIQSVLDQTYSNWELIIVDDGSKDNSVEVIKEFCAKDSRVHLYQHEGGVNKGLAETVKLGIQKASGEWIAFLESDDIFEPNCLEEKVKILNKNSKAGFIFSDLTTFGDEGKQAEKGKWHNKIRKYLKKRSRVTNFSYDMINRNSIMTFSIVMVKKELLKDCDFNSPVKTYLDYWLWIQIARKTKCYYLDMPLTRWRVHADSYINSVPINLESFGEEIKRFYKGDFIADCVFFVKELKKAKQSMISIKFGKNYHLRILGLNILGSKK